MKIDSLLCEKNGENSAWKVMDIMYYIRNAVNNKYIAITLIGLVNIIINSAIFIYIGYLNFFIWVLYFNFYKTVGFWSFTTAVKWPLLNKSYTKSRLG